MPGTVAAIRESSCVVISQMDIVYKTIILSAADMAMTLCLTLSKVHIHSIIRRGKSSQGNILVRKKDYTTLDRSLSYEIYHFYLTQNILKEDQKRLVGCVPCRGTIKST